MFFEGHNIYIFLSYSASFLVLGVLVMQAILQNQSDKKRLAKVEKQLTKAQGK